MYSSLMFTGYPWRWRAPWTWSYIHWTDRSVHCEWPVV